jgi:hypothetical protein
MHSMVAEDFEPFPQRILAEAELAFSKGTAAGTLQIDDPECATSMTKLAKTSRKYSESNIVNFDECSWPLVMGDEQVVAERQAEVNKYRVHICLTGRVLLSKRSTVVWIWTNSELSQSPSNPGSAVDDPLEDLRLSASHSLTPFSNCRGRPQSWDRTASLGKQCQTIPTD